MQRMIYDNVEIHYTTYACADGISIEINELHPILRGHLKYLPLYRAEEGPHVNLRYVIRNPDWQQLEGLFGKGWSEIYDAILGDVVQELRSVREFRLDTLEEQNAIDHPCEDDEDDKRWNSEEDGPPGEPDTAAVGWQERAEADHNAKYYGKGL
jgi:hypothetical protein